jgi:hypothetical protein
MVARRSWELGKPYWARGLHESPRKRGSAYNPQPGKWSGGLEGGGWAVVLTIRRTTQPSGREGPCFIDA